MNGQDIIFVVDIGTRFVRGLVCRPLSTGAGMRLSIIDSEIVEHETRAMRAGQIHDVPSVAATVARIRSTLAARCGAELTSVAAAVAGRNLVTCRGMADARLPLAAMISEEEVKRLEMRAVQDALEKIAMDDEYYCVGYSAVTYRLDGEELTKLVDHRGSCMEAEVLVTLLPRPVLEAMFAVMEKVGLEIDYLTLEPIAALESTVPESLRLLNLVLVDIGAGTSDIAVIAKGKVTAYGMVPLAGDMITEALCAELLLDFNEGERIKRDLGGDHASRISFKTIFNRETSLSRGEVLARLRPAVHSLAERIAAEVRAIVPGLADQNGRGSAVVLVGGGSLTPFLEDETAALFGLPREHVGTRPASFNKEIEDISGKLSGPEAATATGIGLLAVKKLGLSMMHLVFNDTRVTVLSPEKNPSAFSVLLSRGIPIRQIYGRPGLARTYMYNGELRTAKGGAPVPATVELNGQKAALDAPVKEGDSLSFYPAKDGADSCATIAEALELPVFRFNGIETVVPSRIRMNGAPASPATVIEDRAELECEMVADLRGVLEALGIDPEEAAERTVRIEIDGRETSFGVKRYAVSLNGFEIAPDPGIIVRKNDSIDVKEHRPEVFVGDIAPRPPAGRDLRVKINGSEFVFPGASGRVLVNGAEAEASTPVRNGDRITTEPGRDAEAALVDVFRYVTLDPNDRAGRRLKLLINGQDSQFTSALFENAEVNVGFE